MLLEEFVVGFQDQFLSAYPPCFPTWVSFEGKNVWNAVVEIKEAIRMEEKYLQIEGDQLQTKALY